MDTVVDLTESPPLATDATAAAVRNSTTHGEGGDVVSISSDEEASNALRIPGSDSLPRGFVLPPIRAPGVSEAPGPERISTLRELLYVPNSRRVRRNSHSSRSSSRRQPPPLGRPPAIANAMRHSGEEPVEPGAYRPIRGTSLLPDERRRQWSRANVAAAREHRHVRPFPRPSISAALGEETIDGAIDVEGVDDSHYEEEANEYRSRREQADIDLDQMGDDDMEYDYSSSGDRGVGFGDMQTAEEYDDDEEEDDDDDNEEGSGGPDPRTRPTREAFMRWLMNSRLGSAFAGREENLVAQLEQQLANGMAGGEGGDVSVVGEQPRVRSRRGRPRQSRFPFIFPFHPGLGSHHFQRSSANGLTPLDFFPSDDLSELLAFLDASAPAAPSRPLSPLPPLKLSKRQEELAATDEYTRKVPDINYRDATDPPTPDSLEIICTFCDQTLYDKEPVWASKCGHMLCNTCVDEITGASKTCKACKKKIAKKSLVHIFT
ncbi:hypothetical protein GGI12_001329 [Dipsacomyces acuminosporus]|nr:hypothetical protein GGI12_001329 [Dipsacomyces acuminosporus]